MEPYKWYRASEVLPEDTDFPKDSNGVVGFFNVALHNGDLYCVNRWYDNLNDRWYWDADDDYYDRMILRDGITHWMKIEQPALP